MATLFVHRIVSDNIVWPSTPKRSAKSVHLSKVDLMFQDHIRIGSSPFWDRILCVYTAKWTSLSGIYAYFELQMSAIKLASSKLKSNNKLYMNIGSSFNSLIFVTSGQVWNVFSKYCVFHGFLSEICTSLIRDSTILFIVFQHGSSVCLW